MAQAQSGEKMQEAPEMEVKERPFKFNAQAQEFVPTSQTQMPISGYFYPCFHLLGGSAAAAPEWVYVGDHDPSSYFISNPTTAHPNCSKNVLSDDLHNKIIKQVLFFLLLVFFPFCGFLFCFYCSHLFEVSFGYAFWMIDMINQVWFLAFFPLFSFSHWRELCATII